MSVSKTQSQKHGLGRGFESLIPTDLLDESFDPTATQDQKVSDLRQIKLDQIVVDPDQPRKQFDSEAIEELASSIREHGVLQPIILSPFNNGYQIVAGERRYRAAKIAGLDKIPALIRTLTNQHKLEISLIENLQRENLNVMETATAYQKLRSQFNMSLEQIAAKVGNRSFSTISNTLRLLRLPDFIQEALANGSITEGQARPLINTDADVLKAILPRIINEEWSARKIEQFIVDLKKNRTNESLTASRQLTEQPYQEQVDLIKKHLKTDVKIHTNTKGQGYITIKFKNEDDFNRLRKIIS